MKKNATMKLFAPLLLVAVLAATLAMLISPPNSLDIEPIFRSRSHAQGDSDALAAADVSALRWQTMGNFYMEHQLPSSSAPVSQAEFSPQAKLAYHSSSVQAVDQRYSAKPEVPSPRSQAVSPAPQAKLAYHSSSVQAVDQRYSAKPEVPSARSQAVSPAPQAKLAYHSSNVQPVDQRYSAKPAVPTVQETTVSP